MRKKRSSNFIQSLSRLLVISLLSLCLLAVAAFLLTDNVVLANTKADKNSNDKASEYIQCVVLLHGLARTSSSMSDMRQALLENGFAVANINYPSRTQTVQALAAPAIEAGIMECAEQGAVMVHLVTHSMGGILARYYLSIAGGESIEKIVMLAPPNKGSEAVDALKDVPGFIWLNGPAGAQLGTGDSSLPLALGPVNADVGIIAGTFSINLILSSYLPDPDDGKVSVESTRLAGMCAHLQMDVSHPFIMSDEAVIANTIHYLQTGRFLSKAAEYLDCAARH